MISSVYNGVYEGVNAFNPFSEPKRDEPSWSSSAGKVAALVLGGAAVLGAGLILYDKASTLDGLGIGHCLGKSNSGECIREKFTEVVEEVIPQLTRKWYCVWMCKG